MAIFTLLYIDGSSLWDRSMLLSTARKIKHITSKPCFKTVVYITYGSLCSPIFHSMFRVIEYCDTVELLEILITSYISKPMRDRERERDRKKETERARRGKRRNSSSHLEGFQQAHTVTRVMRRNMPPVDRMMYSELRPEPQW